MPAPADLVHESSTTTGTGNFTLAEINGKRRFSSPFGTGGSNVFDYFISNRSAVEWERGTGSMSDANTLVRDTVIASSNADAAVNFSAGLKDVTNDIPAAKQVTTDTTQTLTGKTISGASNTLTVLAATQLSGAVPVANGGTGQTTEAEAIGELIQALTEDTAPDYAADYIATYDASADTGKKVLLSVAVRERLAADRTYYVRTDGSDSNTGLVNNSGGAFLTIQKAIDVVTALDIGIYDVTISVGAGTYTGGVTVSGAWLGSGTVALQGDTTTPANVIISTTSENCINVSSGGRLTVGGFQLQTTTSGNGIVVDTSGNVRVTGKMRFAAMAGYAHMESARGGSWILLDTDYDITGATIYHFVAADQGYISASGVARTVTITGTPNFSGAFAYATRLGSVSSSAVTFSGSATGVRYSGTLLSLVNTFGGGANYFPGGAAGSVATNSVYA